MEDEKIIALFFERDEQAVAETEKKYRGLCISLSDRILKNSSDAEECFSDTLMALWNSIPPKRPENLKAYICKVIRNLSLTKLDYNFAKKRTSDCEVSLEELEYLIPDGASEKSYDGVELGMVIDGFLSSVKPEARKIFVRRYFFFDSVEDISLDLGISQSKVKSVLSRTVKRLRSYLTEKERL